MVLACSACMCACEFTPPRWFPPACCHPRWKVLSTDTLTPSTDSCSCLRWSTEAKISQMGAGMSVLNHAFSCNAMRLLRSENKVLLRRTSTGP